MTKAVLVSVWLPEVSEADHVASQAEMTRLAATLGYEIVATVTQRRDALASAAVLGEGKLRELAELTGGSGKVPSLAKAPRRKAQLRQQDDDAEQEAETAPRHDAPPPVADTIVLDNDVSPSQMRNLEAATSADVLDRSGVIIEIFHRHAKTREARLQVELARLAYEAPRLRLKPQRADRVRAGSVGGSGESDLELDRRRIRDRIAALRRELGAIASEGGTRRARRRDEATVALVGYTNAGKSSLMRALTGSEVLVADRLFATLGTTVRAMPSQSQQRILISDTVGFIQNLPHDLVASFRSTLEEAHDASLLLFVVDASDTAFRTHLQVTQDVLHDIGVTQTPRRLILNKVDRIEEETRAALRREFPDATLLSSRSGDDVAALRHSLEAFFEADWEEASLQVPYATSNLLGDIRTTLRVLHESHDEHGVQLRVRGPREALTRLQRALAGKA